MREFANERKKNLLIIVISRPAYSRQGGTTEKSVAMNCLLIGITASFHEISPPLRGSFQLKLDQVFEMTAYFGWKSSLIPDHYGLKNCYIVST
jgi:hypothetical protein